MTLDNRGFGIILARILYEICMQQEQREGKIEGWMDGNDFEIIFASQNGNATECARPVSMAAALLKQGMCLPLEVQHGDWRPCCAGRSLDSIASRIPPGQLRDTFDGLDGLDLCLLVFETSRPAAKFQSSLKSMVVGMFGKPLEVVLERLSIRFRIFMLCLFLP